MPARHKSMSNHFTYEIDERNLRVKLKDLEFPYKEEAWQHFENATKTSQKINDDANRTKIHFTLNRNILLPVLFAGIIILFSIVLFNFISIKKTPDVRTKELIQNLDKNKSMGPTAAPVEKTEPKKTELVLDVKTEKNSLSQTGITPLEAAITTSVSAIKEKDQTTSASGLDSKAVTQNVKDSGSKKVIRKRTAQPIVTEHLPDIRPVLKTEETEPEIR
jgi:hypothetical protein